MTAPFLVRRHALSLAVDRHAQGLCVEGDANRAAVCRDTNRLCVVHGQSRLFVVASRRGRATGEGNLLFLDALLCVACGTICARFGIRFMMSGAEKEGNLDWQVSSQRLGNVERATHQQR